MIVSRTLKVMGNHVMFYLSVWFLRVTMSSSRALFRLLICIFVTIFFRSMYNKIIIRFGFCDIRNNQGLDKGYQRCKCCFTMKVFQFYVHSNNEFGTMVTLGSQLVQYSFQVLLQLKTTYRVQQKGLESLKSYSFAELYSCSWSSILCRKLFGTCIYLLRPYQKIHSLS